MKSTTNKIKWCSDSDIGEWTGDCVGTECYFYITVIRNGLFNVQFIGDGLILGKGQVHKTLAKAKFFCENSWCEYNEIVPE